MAMFGVRSFFCRHSQKIWAKQPSACLACEVECLRPPAYAPCLRQDIVVERAYKDRAVEMRPLLYQNYFACDPSIAGLMMPENSKYLGFLANKYCSTGDRWLAYHVDHVRKKRKLIGALAAYLKYPDDAKKLSDCAKESPAPDCFLMHFTSHCLKHPDLYKKYGVPCVYDIELLTAMPDTHYWVRDLLIYCAFRQAKRMDYPLVRLLATDHCLFATCTRTGMFHEWMMNYKDFRNARGMNIFWPNNYETTVNLFTYSLDPPNPSNYSSTPITTPPTKPAERKETFSTNKPLKVNETSNKSKCYDKCECLID